MHPIRDGRTRFLVAAEPKVLDRRSVLYFMMGISTRHLAYGFAAAFGLNALLRRVRSGAVVLCYHNVIAGPRQNGEKILHMQSDAFERDISWMASRFEFVFLSELVARIRQGRSVRGLAAISFDDAYVGTFDNALPILRHFTVPSTIFVTSGASGSGRSFWWDWPEFSSGSLTISERDRLLTQFEGDAGKIAAEFDIAPANLAGEYLPADWSRIRTARDDLVEFGAHSVTHRALPFISDDQLNNELTVCSEAIQEQLGVRPTLFAYPYGLYDHRVLRAVAESGFDGALTLAGRDVRVGTNAFAVPRVNIPGVISGVAFRGTVSGAANLRAIISP